MSAHPVDVIRARNRANAARQGVGPLAAVTDDELIETMVAHGQPRWSAQEIRHNPQLRLAALRFWADVQDAAEGDGEAQLRVDYLRETWVRFRAADVVADRPGWGLQGDEAMAAAKEILH